MLYNKSHIIILLLLNLMHFASADDDHAQCLVEQGIFYHRRYPFKTIINKTTNYTEQNHQDSRIIIIYVRFICHQKKSIGKSWQCGTI